MNCRKQMLTALVLLGTMMPMALCAQASAEKKAQELFNMGNYKSCAAELEKVVGKSDASPEALTMAMRANLRCGNPKRASLLASALLKKVGTRDIDIVFEAAQAAELGGDEKMALSRYQLYLKHCPDDKGATPKMIKAATYLSSSGQKYVEALAVYILRDGMAARWYMVTDYEESFLRNRDAGSLLQLCKCVFMENKQPLPQPTFDHFFNLLVNYRGNISKNDARQLLDEVLSRIQISDTIRELNSYNNAVRWLATTAELDAKTYANVACRIVESCGRIPGDIAYDPISRYLNSMKDVAAKQSYAENNLLPLMNIYLEKATNKDHVGYYILLLTEAKANVSPEDMAKLCKRRNALVNTQFDEDNGWGVVWNNIIHGLYKGDVKKQEAFFKAFLPAADTQSYDWALRNLTGDDFEPTKAGTAASKYFAGNNRSIRLLKSMDGLAYKKANALFLESLKMNLLYTDYREDYVADRVRQSGVSAAEVAKVLSEVVKTQGATAKTTKLAADLKRIAFPDGGAAIDSAVKGGKNGSDSALTALAQLFATPKEDKAAVAAAYSKYLGAFTGKIPQTSCAAKSISELGAYNAHQFAKPIIWGDAESMKKLIPVILPKMNGNGKVSDELLSRAWSLDGAEHAGGLYYQCIKFAIANGNANADQIDFWGREDHVRNDHIQPKADSVPFDSYVNVGYYGIQFLFNNVDAFSKDFFFKQMEKAFNEPKNKLNRSALQNINNQFWSNNFKYKQQIPLSTLKAMLQCLVRASETEGMIDLSLEGSVISQAVGAANSKEMITLYASLVAKRSFTNRVLSLCNNNMPNWRNDGMKDFYFDFYGNNLMPLLNKTPEKDWCQISYGRALEFYGSIVRGNEFTPAEKEKAKPNLNKLCHAVLTGSAALPGDPASYAEILRDGLEAVVKEGKVTAINRAAIVIGRALARDGNTWRGTNVGESVLQILEKQPDQIKYVFLSSFTTGNSSFNMEMKKKFQMQMAKFGKNVPGLVAADKADPAYLLFEAQQIKAEGNALQAWSYVREKLPLFQTRWKEFDFDFALWVLDQSRKSGMFKEANELGQTMWMDEAKLPVADAARLGLAKGDVYRDWKNYPAAKIEYESLANNKKYSKTPAGRLAKFRLVELLILTQDFATARSVLERLENSKMIDDQAEAYYLQARVDYEQVDDESAMQNLQEVFLRNSSHPEGRLLQGQIMLRTNRLTTTELEIGQKKLATIAIPGRPIKLVIQDSNLSVIRGGKSLPVLVTTSVGKDIEHVELMPDQQDPNKFSAELSTILGKAVPNNMILELCGDDEITYQVDPKYQEENGKTNLPPNKLVIRYPAKLFASSEPILSEEDQEEMKVLQALELTTKSNNYSIYRSNIVRPGNPIYIRVKDFAMSKNPNKPDTVYVDVISSSGDELHSYPLVETGNSTGEFEAKIGTARPYPNVTASDSVEGIDLNAIINKNKKGSWKSLPDGKHPKWIEVDTMESSTFKDALVKMVNPTAVKAIKVYGLIDKENVLLATYPDDSSVKNKGGVRVYVKSVSGNPPLRNLEGMFATLNREDSSLIPTTSYTRDLQAPKKYRDRANGLCSLMTGAFYLDSDQELEFKFLQKPSDSQSCYLLVDDRLLISGRMNASGLTIRRKISLAKGVHTLKVYFSDSGKDATVVVGTLQQDGSYKALPSDWFNAEKNPELAAYLLPKGKLKLHKDKSGKEDGFQFVMNEPLKGEAPARYRKMRFVFEEFNGTQLEVQKIAIRDVEKKYIVPADNDLSTGKDNKVLEVAAADQITVRYEDKHRIDENKAVLTEQLTSSFFDARIDFSYEIITEDEEGRKKTTWAQAKRASQGDAIVLRVQDPDEDTSEDRQIVKVRIETSSGEKMNLELLEIAKDAGWRGVFVETFMLGKKTDEAKRTIGVKPGDRVVAYYWDNENNHPGVKMERSAVLENDEGTNVLLTVFDTQVEKIEDKSQAALARVQMLKNKAGNKNKEFKIYKDIVNASPIDAEKLGGDKIVVVNSKAPLMFDVLYPKNAKHSGCVTVAEILTESEQNAAQAERREAEPVRVEMPLKPLSSQASAKGYPSKITGRSNSGSLEEGLFAGVVRLQLGSVGDEVNDLVTSSDTFNILSNENVDLDSEAFRVPTVIVSGSDKITISIKDENDKTIAKRVVQLRSDGELELYDKGYNSPTETAHLGQHFYVQVYDPDCDVSDKQDKVEVLVKSAKTGDTAKLVLTETLVHSGIFNGSLKVDLKSKKEANPVKTDTNVLWSDFGDKVTFTYVDLKPLHSDKPQNVVKTGTVVIGSDGELAAFTKKFKDPDMAVKTNFLMAEALFELAKSHKAIKGSDGKPDEEKKAQATREIAKGKRVLEEALRDYPNTSLKAQGEFLLANLQQQLEEYDKAIIQFSAVISKYPDSEFAPKSYFQKAVCYDKKALAEKDPQRKEKLGDNACEEYISLTYLYPTSTLAMDAKLRLGNYYYRTNRFKMAASVLEKFALAYPENPRSAQALLLAGYAFRKEQDHLETKVKGYKKDYTAAVRVFSMIEEKYKDNKTVRSEAMYWAGDCLYALGTHEGQVKAYQFFQKLIWDYPESKWAKHARGRMAANPIKNTR